MRIGLVTLFSLFALLTLSTVGSARADDASGWRLRVDFALVDPSDDTVSVGSFGGSTRASFDTGAGFGVRGEYQFSERLGIDFGFLSTASVDVSTSLGGSSVDISTFSPITVGIDFHLTPGKKADLYIGPQVAWVDYGDIDVDSTPGSAATSISIDNDLGLGAILGLDVPLGDKRHWAFQTSLRYFATSMDGDVVDVDFDPAIFSLGFGYRW